MLRIKIISNIQQSISPDSIAAVSPENVYIMMGTNGVAWLKSSDMIDSYEDVTCTISNSKKLGTDRGKPKMERRKHPPTGSTLALKGAQT